MRKDAPLTVDIPSPDRDSPGWVKVGVIAAIGFVIGIAWPRLVGVKLGPSAPNEAAAAASAAHAARAPDAPPASVSTKATTQPSAALSAQVVSASASAAPPGPPQINVLKGAILSCKTDDGETKKGKECGAIASLDQVVVPRLRKIASCGGAEGQTGKLSFVVNADYASGKFSWDVSKASTVGNVDQLTTCLKTHFQGVSVAGAAHENPRYTVSYTAVFTAPPPPKEEKTEPATPDKTEAKTAPDTTPKGDEPKAEPATGEATVAWEVALVRDVPKTGQVVARLPRGSKVKLGSVKDGWYAIKYGDAFGSDGWVYRGAIGR